MQPRSRSSAGFKNTLLSNRYEYVRRKSMEEVREDMPATADTRCGLGWFSPTWLQPLASKKTFVILYGLFGCSFFATGSYFDATISTMEKQFKMSSQTFGIIASAQDITQCCTALVMGYLGSRGGHKTRWVAAGGIFASISCFIIASPYFLFGAGEDALSLTEGPAMESRNSSTESYGGKITLCGSTSAVKDCSEGLPTQLSSVTLLIILSRILNGIGQSMYWTLGVAYLDDNVKKTKSPVYISIAACLRMFGPTVGFLLASYTLAIYVEPGLRPTINNTDPRWIGAWWLGWLPSCVVVFMIALSLAMFPRMLPRTAARIAAAGTKTQPPSSRSLADFKRTMTALIKNKIYMYNSLSLTCFFCGYMGYWVFLPKYMETQFRQTAARASLLIGSLGVASTGAGLLVSGIAMSRFQPGPRKIAAWNVIVEMTDVLTRVFYMFIGCPVMDLHGHWTQEKTWNLTMDCNSACDCEQHGGNYAPICSFDKTTTFYSACYAGCRSQAVTNQSQSYFDCSCGIGEGPMTDGACPVDCSSTFMTFLICECLVRFLSATGRAGNSLIQYRCVNPQDKGVSLGLAECILSLFAYIPGPIIYGMIIDSTCLVWGSSCGQPGNCWLYDGVALRYALNGTAAGFMLLGTAMDIGVWANVKGLKIYYDGNETEEDHGGVELRENTVLEREKMHGNSPETRMLNLGGEKTKRGEGGREIVALLEGDERVRNRSSEDGDKEVNTVEDYERTTMLSADETGDVGATLKDDGQQWKLPSNKIKGDI